MMSFQGLVVETKSATPARSVVAGLSLPATQRNRFLKLTSDGEWNRCFRLGQQPVGVDWAGVVEHLFWRMEKELTSPNDRFEQLTVRPEVFLSGHVIDAQTVRRHHSWPAAIGLNHQ